MCIGPVCKRCGEEYRLEFDEEPTPYCDDCAHVVVDELKRRVWELESGLAGYKQAYETSRQECIRLTAEQAEVFAAIGNVYEDTPCQPCSVSAAVADIHELRAQRDEARRRLAR